MNGQTILIAGGYGIVGSRIATQLASLYPSRVVVAGRHLQRADAVAATIGHGVRGRALDVTMSPLTPALEDVAVIVSCIDQPERRLMHEAIECGIRYTDITPHLTELGRADRYEQIDAAARRSGAVLLLGAGLVPGISNVMVRSLADTLGGADTIETSLLLSARDAAGPGSFDYLLKELTMTFDVHTNGTDQPTRAFSDPTIVQFPAPIGPRHAYLFPFSDQVLYPRTMGASTVSSRLALDPGAIAPIVRLLTETRAARFMSSGPLRRAVEYLRAIRRPSDEAPFALRVDVTRGATTRSATLIGKVQAGATSAGASVLVRSLVDGELADPGAWMPEQAIDPALFFARLREHGFTVDLP